MYLATLLELRSKEQLQTTRCKKGARCKKEAPLLNLCCSQSVHLIGVFMMSGHLTQRSAKCGAFEIATGKQ